MHLGGDPFMKIGFKIKIVSLVEEVQRPQIGLQFKLLFLTGKKFK